MDIKVKINDIDYCVEKQDDNCSWDKDVEQCIAELRKECPNWDDDISCNTESVDVCSEQFDFLMDQYGRAFLYIVVSLGDDELSMQTAISLCRY